MGGGLMQLVAYGSQDIYLTGNPQITFFKIVYRRHTNFSMECIQQTINGASTLSNLQSSTGTVVISRNGDLLSQIYLRTDQDLTSGINGDYLIEEVEIEIGGQRIDKHYREWNQVWTELTTPNSKAEGFKYMTGGYTNNLITGNSTGGTGQQSIMYPLQFWFCRNIGLALPLIALQYHDVKLKCTWSSGGGTDGVSRDGVNAVTPSVEMWADYVYLDTDERRRFAQVSHEYLIEQLQIQEEGSSRSEYKLNFDHPIKELIWTVPTSTTEANTIISQQLKLEMNGHDRFAYQDREYFQLKHPFVYHTSIPGYNIKENDNPTLIQPIIIAYRDAGTATGTLTTTLHNTVSSTSGTKMIFNLYVGTSFIPTSSSSNFPKVGDLLDIEIRDKSEIATAARFRRITSQVSSITSRTNGWDIGIVIEDDQDSIGTSFIVGTTADDCISISIIARTQNPQSRCSQLDRDIFVYSFALNPEDHQPSGTCNFSKIDSAKLLLSSDGIISNIYAVNYNVLRIMSGMGGLAYAI